MSRLPPVEKLPLAARKDIRDNWESAKDGFAQDLSSLLGQTWTIDVSPNQLYAYAKEGYAKEQPGAMIAQYIGAALDRLRSSIDRHGDAGKKEINDVCTAHALTLDVNTEHDFLYNGCAVTPEGQLAILFNEDKLAVNIDDPLEEDKLAKALNSAPTAGAAMSYVARSSIENGWEKDAEETKKKFSDILQTEVALDPQFQQTHDALKASSEIELDRWEGNIGDFTRFYFEALANGLKSQNFDSDEMMREALVEALEKGRIAFRIVEKSQMKALYNECVFEDGILYMQTTAERFGANIDNVADGLVDLL